MSLEPQKFFIGLVDFFSILMPGALVTYLGRNWAAHVVLGRSAFPLTDAEGWIVFLFASYLLGHFAFLIGAKLDDWVYDPLRKATYWGQISRLANGKGLSGGTVRWLTSSKWLFGSNADAAVLQAQRIKARALDALSAEGAINTYQWSKARLSKDHPEGLAAVQRFEADSKFFRSFCVVLAVLAVVFLRQGQGHLLAALACAAFLLLALWRYVDQRFKATQQAYWFVITIESLKQPSPAAATAPARGGPTHAGGVVFRQRGAAVQYLLVQSSTSRFEWVLPKGHIEPGEDPRETAVREVNEETGHWAQVRRWIQDLQLGAAPGAPTVRFYLMEAVQSKAERKAEDGWPPENRQREWLTLPDAKGRASFGESRLLLENADRIRAERFADHKEK